MVPWCVVLLLAGCAHAARLLAVLPTNTKSHHAMYGRLIDALANKHHQITLVSHFPLKRSLPNVHEINLAGTIPEITNNLTEPHTSLKPDFIQNLENIMTECVSACDIVSKFPAFRALLNSTETFDLVIIEVFGSDCFLPLGRKYGAPVVGLLSSVPLPWVNTHLGNPEATAYVPAYMLGYGQRMTLIERFVNTMAVFVAKVMYKYKSLIPSQKIADNVFGPGSNLESLVHNYSLILSNSHFSINEVRPIVPTLVEVGGLHLDDTPSLPHDMKKLLDVSTEGVIYWSFGSMSRIETIPTDTLAAIFRVLAELPSTVLVKMDRRRLARNLTVPENVYTMDWIPQHATLCHPNVRVFISHGGLLGIQEAVACGVPMLMVPLYADQALNARALADRGVARLATLAHADTHTWRTHLHQLLTNPEYKENAMILRNIFLDRPMKPLDMGVYWIEYVLRHKGAPHLRSPALDLTHTQHLLLDVLALNVVATSLTVYILHKLFRYLCNRCIKWWPKQTLVIQKKLFKKNIIVFICGLRKYKVKTQ